MTWLDKVKERWKRDELEVTLNNDVLFERFVQAREDRAKLLRLVAYVQHRKNCAHTTGSYERDDACSCGLTALLESDDA